MMQPGGDAPVFSKRNTEILSRIPMGRRGNEQDLKGVAVFLAAKASNYLSGAVIPIDVGYLGG